MAVVVLDPGVELLSRSSEPLIRWRALVDLADLPATDAGVRGARRAIPSGPIVRALVEPTPERHWYSKWRGAHWRLTSLMDLGAPADLPGAAEQVEPAMRGLTGGGRKTPVARTVEVIEGRARFCASQDGNALAYAVHFGLAGSARAAVLAEMLAKWQWPAGGWNCDRRPATTHPSVNESFPALRGLAAYARVTGDRGARDAADRAAEFFLRHRVAWSERTGSPIHPVVVRLQYPPYWHYDVLAGLRALLESGHLDDPRTADALDLVESKRRPDGAWSADSRHDRPPGTADSLVEIADWQPNGKDAPHEALTLSALTVLKAAGRLR